MQTAEQPERAAVRAKAPRPRRTTNPSRSTGEGIQWVQIPWECDEVAVQEAVRCLGGPPTTPERLLLLGMLELAIRDISLASVVAQYDPQASQRKPAEDGKPCGEVQHFHRKVVSDALAWMLSDDDDYPFAFRPVCAQLGFDPDAILDRLRVRRWAHLARWVNWEPDRAYSRAARKREAGRRAERQGAA